MSMDSLLDYQLWQFPDFEESEAESSDASLSELYTQETESYSDEVEEDVLLPEIAESEWYGKLQLMDELSKKMKETCMALDEALLYAMVDMIKQSVHKLVYKSLSLDPALIKEMVEKTLSEMNLNNTTCEVRVSTADFVYVSEIELPYLSFKEDSSLSSGDFVILTPVQQIQAILSERIDVLLEGV